MEGVVAPFDQLFPEAEVEVNVTDPPEQNVVGPLAMIFGVEGIVFTVITVPDEAGEVQPFMVAVTV